jgi:hypothetical protein
MADRTAAHYELARALIRYEAGDVIEALRLTRDTRALVADDDQLVFRLHALVAAMERERSKAHAGDSVARAYQSLLTELRRATQTRWPSGVNTG